MSKIGRNELCPCGSGKKYKRCCIGVKLPAKIDRPEISDAELLKEHRRTLEELERRGAERASQYGLVRPIISTVWQGRRWVAVGSRVYSSESWKTVPDFLGDYIKWTLGEEWGNGEIRKPFEERHPVLQWYDGLCRFQAANFGTRDEDGIFSGEKDGATAAYYQLAYDLYVLADHQKLQETLVERLKMPAQFQGARHEIAVATHCIIAGFEIEHEDESDKSTKHPEFMATHKVSGQTIAVEAKSRHRPGVLGFPGELQEDPSAGVKRILKKAREKAGSIDAPFAVFVDLNLPPKPDEKDLREVPWFKEIVGDIARRGKRGERWYNMLIFTNRPQHYGAGLASNPGFQVVAVLSLDPKVKVQHGEALEALRSAAEKYGHIPNHFEE